jgi:hypothetical protein
MIRHNFCPLHKFSACTCLGNSSLPIFYCKKKGCITHWHTVLPPAELYSAWRICQCSALVQQKTCPDMANLIYCISLYVWRLFRYVFCFHISSMIPFSDRFSSQRRAFRIQYIVLLSSVPCPPIRSHHMVYPSPSFEVSCPRPHRNDLSRWHCQARHFSQSNKYFNSLCFWT